MSFLSVLRFFVALDSFICDNLRQKLLVPKEYFVHYGANYCSKDTKTVADTSSLRKTHYKCASSRILAYVDLRMWTTIPNNKLRNLHNKGGLFLLLCALTLPRGTIAPMRLGELMNRNGCPVDSDDPQPQPHEQCNMYFECERGALVVQQCEAGKFFQLERRKCYPKERVNCERKVTHPGAAYQCFDYTAAPVVCAAPNSDDVLVPHENCNRYYVCKKGVPVEVKCLRTTLHYNPVNEYCDWPEHVNCGNRYIPEDNSNEDHEQNPCTESGTDNLVFSHEICNKYYQCIDGEKKTYTCEGKLLFDPTKGYCSCPQSVVCGDREIVEIDDTNNHDVECGSTAVCSKKNSNGILIAHEKCSKFYKCWNSKAIVLVCPSGLNFNPSKATCDLKEKVDCKNRSER